ncbi:MAG: hypothetical protein LPK49_06860, partial [Bacteroidota bacterium]|nr:hypothetical protein [Bacteroidota bacterium]
MVLFQACQEQEGALYTPEFKEDVDQLNLIRNERNIETFLRRLDSSFNKLDPPRPLDWYEYYNFRAWYNRSQNNQNNAIRYTDSMLLVITPYTGTESYYVHALTQKGFLLQEINLFNEALTEFYKANTYAEQYLTKCDAGEVIYNLGLLLYQQEKYRECLRFYRQARSYAAGCDTLDFAKFYYPIQGAFNAEGLCYEKMGMLDSAKLMYLEGIEFLERYGPYYTDENFKNVAHSVIEGNLGYVEFLLGNIQEAETLLKNSIRSSLETAYDLHDAIYSQMKLGRLLINGKRFDEFRELMALIQDELNEAPFNSGYYRYYSLLSEYQAATNDSAAALRSQTIALKYQDSIRAVMTDLSSLNVQTTMSYMQQQEDLLTLKKDNERKLIFLIITFVIL